LEAQQHKKYAQTTPLDDGVSYLFCFAVVIGNNKNVIFENEILVILYFAFLRKEENQLAKYKEKKTCCVSASKLSMFCFV
jgi:ABC-type polysaccharide/polyol phosphate transport system ATPase subunit